MKINPKCLAFGARDNKGAAYTSDGYMLPCCWLDDPPVHRYICEAGLKDEELAVANNSCLDDIFVSDQWENFFQTILNDPAGAPYMCKKKCGFGFDEIELRAEEKREVKEQASGTNNG